MTDEICSGLRSGPSVLLFGCVEDENVPSVRCLLYLCVIDTEICLITLTFTSLSMVSYMSYTNKSKNESPLLVSTEGRSPSTNNRKLSTLPQ